MSEWQTIDSAPKDGRAVRVMRLVDGRPMFDRTAAWRTITLPAANFYNPAQGLMSVPEEQVTGWCYVDCNKRVLEPTHWMPIVNT